MFADGTFGGLRHTVYVAGPRYNVKPRILAALPETVQFPTRGSHTPLLLTFNNIKAKRGIGAKRSPTHMNYTHFCHHTRSHQCDGVVHAADSNPCMSSPKKQRITTMFCLLEPISHTVAPVRWRIALVRERSPMHRNYKHFCKRANRKHSATH